MMQTRSWIGGLVTVVVAAVLVAIVVVLGRDTATTVELTLEDFGIEPAEFSLPAGEPVTLVLDNRSDFDHNLSFGRSPVEEGGAVVGFGDDLFAGLDAAVDPAVAWIEPTGDVDSVTVSVPADSTVTVEVTLPEERVGTWQVGCYLGPSCGREALAATLTVE